MRALVGVNGAADNLPAQLAPNKGFCCAPNGTHLWNPDWLQPPTSSLNDD
jgi:hypothetical protein